MRPTREVGCEFIGGCAPDELIAPLGAVELPGSMANASCAFLDEPIARGGGDRLAIATPSRRVSYAELLDLSNRTGNVLRGAGAEPEHRVAMLLPDGVDWAATFFGALRSGAVAVPLDTRLPPVEWAAMIRDSRARVLVADAGLGKHLVEHFAALPDLKVMVASSSLGDLRERVPAELEPEDVGGEDMAFWLYTPGTTDGPKAAVHLHRDLLACRHYGVEVLGAGPGDRVFATSKLFSADALGNALLIPLFAGASTFLHPAWPDPEIVADVMARWRPTLFFSTPALYARLLGAALPDDTFVSLRVAVSAAERLPAEIHGAWQERFGVEILDGLGAPETIFMVLSNRPGASRAGSAGMPVPGTDVRLLDASGRLVPDGNPGVLHVRTPSASPYYWRRVDESRRTFLGEWLRTGDVMTRDTDGFYYRAGHDEAPPPGPS